MRSGDGRARRRAPGGRPARAAPPVAAALGRIDVEAVERAGGWRVVRQWDELEGCPRFLARPARAGADSTPEPAAADAPPLRLLALGPCEGWLERAADLLLELDAPASPGVADAGVVDDRELSLLGREGVEHRRFLVVHATAPLIALATVVGGAARLREGEAVTVLAPIAQTIAAVHDLGRSIGGVSLASTALDDTGRPLLLDWSRIGALPGRAPGHVPAAAREDWLAFARVADAVLSLVDSSEAGRLAERIGRAAERGRDGASIGETVVDALFSFAEPEEVAEDALLARGASERSLRVVAGRSRRSVPRGIAAGETGRRARPSRTAWSLGPTLLAGAAVAGVASAVILGVGRLGAAGGAVDAGAAGAGASPSASSAAAGSAGAEAPGIAPSGAARDGTSAAGPAAAPPPASAVVDRAEAEARVRSAAGPGARAEDAAPALLDLRAACLRECDPACLTGAYQDGAPGLARDGELLAGGSEREVSAAAASLPPGVVVRVRDEYGGLVAVELVDAGAALPTSLTLVRADAGWRLRDVVLPDG